VQRLTHTSMLLVVAAASSLCYAAVEAGGADPAARLAGEPVSGTGSAIVLFARFADEPDQPVPSWADRLLDPDLPGSFSHYYDTMSFGALRVRGEASSRRYAANGPLANYLAARPGTSGAYAAFALEILAAADRDVDFSRYDNDGPDGIPNSGDDDGVVDMVFVSPLSTPSTFLLAEATGIANLGFGGPYVTDDVGAAGQRVLVSPQQGSVLRARRFSEAVGSMCHEYGHILGLTDLYNVRWTQQPQGAPEDDSAGIGNWGLMGRGADGWHGEDGPVSLCAFSRARLGWPETEELSDPEQLVQLTEVGGGGPIYRIPLTRTEYFLVEYRTRSCYYDRNIPAEGLLVWHVARLTQAENQALEVDLECADGLWQDAGYPDGTQAAPLTGKDNLDYWAHDAAYAGAHAGNLGDATDVWDGLRFNSFTAVYNLASSSGSVWRWTPPACRNRTRIRSSR
jgi:M6 family metalloprotease-like protein